MNSIFIILLSFIINIINIQSSQQLNNNKLINNISSKFNITQPIKKYTWDEIIKLVGYHKNSLNGKLYCGQNINLPNNYDGFGTIIQCNNNKKRIGDMIIEKIKYNLPASHSSREKNDDGINNDNKQYNKEENNKFNNLRGSENLNKYKKHIIKKYNDKKNELNKKKELNKSVKDKIKDEILANDFLRATGSTGNKDDMGNSGANFDANLISDIVEPFLLQQKQIIIKKKNIKTFDVATDVVGVTVSAKPISKPISNVEYTGGETDFLKSLNDANPYNNIDNKNNVNKRVEYKETPFLQKLNKQYPYEKNDFQNINEKNNKHSKKKTFTTTVKQRFDSSSTNTNKNKNKYKKKEIQDYNNKRNS